MSKTERSQLRKKLEYESTLKYSVPPRYIKPELAARGIPRSSIIHGVNEDGPFLEFRLPRRPDGTLRFNPFTMTVFSLYGQNMVLYARTWWPEEVDDDEEEVGTTNQLIRLTPLRAQRRHFYKFAIDVVDMLYKNVPVGDLVEFDEEKEMEEEAVALGRLITE